MSRIQRIGGILTDFFIGRHQNHSSGLSLRHQHPIERVLVNTRQISQLKRAIHIKAGRLKSTQQFQALHTARQWQLPKRVLDGDFSK